MLYHEVHFRAVTTETFNGFMNSLSAFFEDEVTVVLDNVVKLELCISYPLHISFKERKLATANQKEKLMFL